MAWTTPPAFTAGMTSGVAAALQQVSDDLAVIGGAWASYSPSWTASSTNPTVGNGTLVGAVKQVDKTVDVLIQITMGSTTSYGSGSWLLSLPATARFTGWALRGTIRDASGPATYDVIADASTTTVLNVRCRPTTAGAPLSSVNNATPMTWASGDVLTLHGRYEAA